MDYVTTKHFDSAVNSLRAEFVTNERFDSELGQLHSEIDSFRSEIMTRMDEQVVILQRLDQERIFTTEWVRRIETDVDRVKKHLKIS